VSAPTYDGIKREVSAIQVDPIHDHVAARISQLIQHTIIYYHPT
jgi:hypothetical protein